MATEYRVISYIKHIAICAFTLTCCTVAADDAEFVFNREKFGGATLPLWSQLSSFEENTLAQISKAKLGDPDALLSLYILAGGSIRDEDTYQRINQQIDQWLSGLESKLKRQRKDIDRASLLHETMHRDFFLTDEDGGSLVGYDADQSQLPEIFVSQRFNCISSSMLYLVLARKVGLNVDAVLLPSHTFVQLNTQSGALVEIETTSVHGFNIEHDSDFYQHDDISWFEARNLEPTTYADYLQRDILTAYELGLQNMWSQHTSAERMAYPDRFRLAEIRGYLQPDDMDAQKNRLNFYLQELGYLNRSQDTANALRLSELIDDYLADVAPMTATDDLLKSLWFGVQTEVALANIQGKSVEKGFALVKHLIEQLEPNSDVSEQLLYNLYVVVSHYVIQELKSPDFAQLRLSLLGMEQACIANRACSQSFGQLYASWAQVFWQQQDWSNASRILTEYLQFDIDNQNSQIFLSNAETAFVNQAKQVLWDGDWKQALNLLQNCVDQLPGQNRCSEQIRYINEQRHMGNL